MYDNNCVHHLHRTIMMNARNSFCARHSTRYSGISYQNVQPYDVIEQEHDTKPDENMLKHSGTNSFNRRFLMNELVLEQHRKEVKMTSFNRLQNHHT